MYVPIRLFSINIILQRKTGTYFGPLKYLSMLSFYKDHNIFSIKSSDCRFVGTSVMNEGREHDEGSSNEVFYLVNMCIWPMVKYAISEWSSLYISCVRWEDVVYVFCFVCFPFTFYLIRKLTFIKLICSQEKASSRRNCFSIIKRLFSVNRRLMLMDLIIFHSQNKVHHQL